MQLAIDTSALDPFLTTGLFAFGGVVATIWLAAAWWAYADMSRRTTSELARLLAAGWILLSTPVLLPLSLGSYLLARPQRTVADRRAELLFAAMAGGDERERCPWCAVRVEPGWRRCPACATWLASACAHCGSWSSVLFEVCPSCAADTGPGAVPEAPPAVTADTKTRGLDVGRGLPRPAGRGSLRRAGS